MKWIKRIFWLSLPILAVLTAAFISNPPEKGQEDKCGHQMGQVLISVPPGETAWTAEVPIAYCPDLNLQITGGTSSHLPIILNAGVHHGTLLITASLLKPEGGPIDVIVWWRVDTAD
jgi:hypothetical protein